MTELGEFSHDEPDRPYDQVGPFVRVVAHLIAGGELDPSMMPDPSVLMAGLPPKLLALWEQEDRQNGILPPDMSQ